MAWKEAKRAKTNAGSESELNQIRQVQVAKVRKHLMCGRGHS